MKKISAFFVSLIFTVSLYAESYTRIPCKVGDDTIILPVPNTYRIVGRDVPWAADYFRMVENLTNDPEHNNTVIVGMASRHMYDFCQKGGQFYGFACEVQCLNKAAKLRVKKKDIPIAMYYVEKEVRDMMTNFKDVKFNTNNSDAAKDLTARQKLFESRDTTFISKSERHITFSLYFRAEQLVRLCSVVVVDGKFIYLYLTKSEADALAGVGEMNNWVEEIKSSTSMCDE